MGRTCGGQRLVEDNLKYLDRQFSENADFGSPGFADFGNFDTPSFANFDSPANTSNTSNTSVEETDFCPPSCSSPSAEEMEKNTDKEEVKQEEEKEVKMECESAPKRKNL